MQTAPEEGKRLRSRPSQKPPHILPLSNANSEV